MGKLLFIFVLGQGHMNVCLSVAKSLINKYPEHEVYFNVDEEFYKKVKSFCPLFKPVLMNKIELPSDDDAKKSKEKFLELFFKTGIEQYFGNFEPISKFQDIYINTQSQIEKVIAQVQPDVILMDQLFSLPFVQNKNIPWYFN